MPGLIQSIDFAALAPVLVVTVAAFAVLLADLLAGPGPDAPAAGGPAAGGPAAGGPVRWRDRLPVGLSLSGLTLGLVAVAGLAGQHRTTFCLPPVGGGGGGGGPACSYEVGALTLLLQAVALAGTAVVVLLSTRVVPHGGLPAAEYHFLLLCSLAGVLTLVAARDLITLLVALEVASLPSVALVGLRRRDGASSEAALKFFLVSVVSAAVTLYGISLLYGVTGTVHLTRLAAALEAGAPGQARAVAVAGVTLTLVGFAFKVSAVPFHFWAPDTYQGAPLPVAAYLSVVSKAAGFAGLMIVVGIGFRPYASAWGPALAVLAALTMSVGNLVALRQRHAVRLLAWSSIGQAGYLLVPFAAAAANPAGDAAGVGRALAATVGYLLVYAVMNLGAFAVVTVVSGSGGTGSLEEYRGLARRSPVLAGCLAFALLCLAGLPPGLVGLFAKIVVFRAAVGGGLGWLAVVMAVNVAIALYYYLRWTAALFAPAGAAEPSPAAGGAGLPGPGERLAVGVTTAAAVVLSVAPQWVLRVLDGGADLLR